MKLDDFAKDFIYLSKILSENYSHVHERNVILQLFYNYWYSLLLYNKFSSFESDLTKNNEIEEN